MKDFLDKIKNDPEVKEMIKALPVPKNDEEALAGYQSVAKQLGFDLSKEDVIAALKALAEEQRAKTDKISLDDEALEHVAGGAGNELCHDTFDEGEWCWFTDSCSYVITDYSAELRKPFEVRVAFDVCTSVDYKHDDYKKEFDVDSIPDD